MFFNADPVLGRKLPGPVFVCWEGGPGASIKIILLIRILGLLFFLFPFFYFPCPMFSPRKRCLPPTGPVPNKAYSNRHHPLGGDF